MSDDFDDLIFTNPVFHEKIWGGRRLETEFGYKIPDGSIGECWAISAHPAGDCTVAGGAYDGRYLSDLWESERGLFAGASGDRFPLLIKILDARENLSVQVHPDDAYAAAHENGSLGKRECWYVLSAEPGTKIVVGQRAHDRAEFARMVEEGRWSELLYEVPIKAGDFFRIEPGTIHAIEGGTLILETQQSSDVTYRVYDYDRVQADGTKRPLHIQQSLDCVDFDLPLVASGEITTPVIGGIQHLEDCDRYMVDLVTVDGEKTFSAIPTFRCVSVIEGEGTVGGRKVAKGTHFIIPAAYGDACCEGKMRLVVSRVPTSL